MIKSSLKVNLKSKWTVQIQIVLDPPVMHSLQSTESKHRTNRDIYNKLKEYGNLCKAASAGKPVTVPGYSYWSSEKPLLLIAKITLKPIHDNPLSIRRYCKILSGRKCNT